jgi:hypothetical protein
MRKKLFVYALIVILTVFGVYFLGAKVTAILGGVAALFGWRTRQMIEDIEQEVVREKKTVEQVKKNREERLKKHKDLQDRMNRFFGIFLIFAILSVAVLAGEPPPDLYIPDSYEELVEMYKEAVMIAIEYQQLYLEAEQDIEVLVRSNENLQKLIEAQREIIEELLKRKGFGIITGLNITPANLENTGILLGVEYKF